MSGGYHPWSKFNAHRWSNLNARRQRRDLTPGPDQLREGLTVIIAAGVEVPATIENHERRYAMWAEYFDVEAEAIRQMQKKAA